MSSDFIKFPRTPHLVGSKLGEGDEDLSKIPFEHIFSKHIVIEEKIDGANCGISFDSTGKLLLQNRGHYFYGGYKERHYDLFKRWAHQNSALLYSVLSSRYVMFGEWMYAKHTVFYDALPDYFMEFDVYDKERGVFLDTESRRAITSALPVCSVPVLAEGEFKSKESILKYLSRSLYITDSHLDTLVKIAEREGADVATVLSETDPSTDMEGLYIKIEKDGIVEERVKFVRSSYVQCAKEATSRWQSRVIIPNCVVKQ